MPRINARVAAVTDPPVTIARNWLADHVDDPTRPRIELAQAAPSYPPARELREHLAALAGREDAYGYVLGVGLEHVRDAVARDLTAMYGATLTGEDVVVTAGCNQAFCLAVGATGAAGDEVVLPSPVYFDHDMWLRAGGVEPVHVPTGPGFVPDPEAIAAAVTPRTRAIVLVTPNNPTGAEYPAAVIAAVADVARRHGIALVLDETYREFREADGPPHHEFGRDDWRDTLIHLTSYSKSLAVPGARVGALVAGPAVRREVAKLLDCQTICAPRAAQEAVAFGIDHLGGWMAERRSDMQARVAAGRHALAGDPGGYHLGASGAFFAYVRHPHADLDATTVARRLLAEQGVLCIPGTAFGADQERWLRLAFGNVDAAVVPEVGRRLAEGIRP